MEAIGLPETIVRAWGPEVATDFLHWIEERMTLSRFGPQIRVSAFVARQQVNVLMLEQVSNLLLAGEPRLVQDPAGSWRWRVPVDLTFPTRGRVGKVGELEVDAHYGGIAYDDASLARIAHAAEQLAQQALEPAP